MDGFMIVVALLFCSWTLYTPLERIASALVAISEALEDANDKDDDKK